MKSYYEMIKPVAERHMMKSFHTSILCAKKLPTSGEGYFIANKTCACVVPISEISKEIEGLNRKNKNFFDRHLEHIKSKSMVLDPMIPLAPSLFIHCKDGKITLLSEQRFEKNYKAAIEKLNKRIQNIKL
jgi:hypothetical protein